MKNLNLHSRILLLRSSGPLINRSPLRFLASDAGDKKASTPTTETVKKAPTPTEEKPSAERETDPKLETRSSNILTDIKSDLHSKHLPKQLSFEDAREAAQKAYALQKRHIEDRLESIRSIFSGKADQIRTPDEEWYYKKVSFWMKRYENFVGLTDVKAAQARVVESEKRFIQMQDKRREAQASIAEVQKRIKDIHLEFEKTHRGEDKYLALVTQEHQVLKEERNLLEEFKFFEKAEREYFSALSNAVRDSHEKERAQAEKTKYWSVLGSILGTCLGIFGTTINNRMRMNELRRLVAQNSTGEEIREIGSEITRSLDEHEKELSSLTVQVHGILNQAKTGLENLDKVESVVDSLKKSEEKINTRTLEETLVKVQGRQKVLSDLITKHEQVLDEKLEAIKSDIFVQSTNVGKLAHIQLKDRERDQKIGEERGSFLKKNFETLTTQNLDLNQSMITFAKEIDDKIKDVRSLLLVEHRMPKFENKLLDRLIVLETGQKKLLASFLQPPEVRVGASNAETITAILETHHKRTRQTVILSTLMVAVLTPLAVYAANHVV